MLFSLTRGAGLIGSHTVPLLREAGHEAIVYDGRSMGHQASLPSEGRLIVVGESMQSSRATPVRYGGRRASAGNARQALGWAPQHSIPHRTT